MVEFNDSNSGAQASQPQDFSTPCECQFSIDGETVTADILSIELNQSVDSHHLLKIHLRETGASTGTSDFSDPSRYTAYLGKSVSVNIAPDQVAVDNERQLNFIGLVTEVKLENSIEGLNNVVVIAHSPTIIMDTLKKNKVFTQNDCSDLVGMIISEHSISQGRLDSAELATDSERDNLEVDSKVQYQETDYDFIKRLASEYGMFAYYDGSAFNVEKATSTRTEDLTWMQDLGSFSVGLGTGPLNYSGTVWDPNTKENVDGSSSKSSIRSSLSDLSRLAVNKSDEIYTSTGVSSSPKHITQSVMDKTLTRETEGAAGKIMICHGQSLVPKITPGCCISAGAMGALEGTYWVKEVKHVLGENGRYHNTFVCTPLELAFPPVYPERQPFSHLQVGLVTDNNDPEDLGRVKVKLPWQGDDEC
jgi:type VI secretion system secreted protein VgrG